MSRVDITVQANLLKEAKAYLKNVKPLSETKIKKDSVELTQEHLAVWLEVFYDDRIRMDTCNQASVKM